MTQVSVAMATYNGARFLGAQLDSLARQTHLPCELVVGDDGSTDATIDILRDFARTAPFPVRIHRNATRLGFADNFLSCTGRCNGRWIAFCDQDDVWLPGKLAAYDRAIRRGPPDLALVYHTAELVDTDLKPIGRRLPRVQQDATVPALGKPGFWFVGGCVLCFRRDLIEGRDPSARPRDNYRGPSDPESRSLVPHDKWICLLANSSGSITALSEPLVQYRRHIATETGYDDRTPTIERLGKALGTGAEEYGFLSERAAGFAAALAGSPAEAKYSRLATAFGLRAQLYGAPDFATRLRAFRGLHAAHAYWGDPFIGWGMKSFIKDFIYFVLGPQVVSGRARR